MSHRTLGSRPLVVLGHRKVRAYDVDAPESAGQGILTTAARAFRGEHADLGSDTMATSYRLSEDAWDPDYENEPQPHPRLKIGHLPPVAGAGHSFWWLGIEYDHIDPEASAIVTEEAGTTKKIKREWLPGENWPEWPEHYGEPTFAFRSKHGWHGWYALDRAITDPAIYEALVRHAFEVFSSVGVELDDRTGDWARLLGLPNAALDPEKTLDHLDESPSPTTTLKWDELPLKPEESPRMPPRPRGLDGGGPKLPEAGSAFIDGDVDALTPAGRALLEAVRRASNTTYPELRAALLEGRGLHEGVRDDAASKGMGWLCAVGRMQVDRGVTARTVLDLALRSFNATELDSNGADFAEKAETNVLKYWDLDQARIDETKNILLEVQRQAVEVEKIPTHRLILMHGRDYFVLSKDDLKGYMPCGSNYHGLCGVLQRRGWADKVGLFWVDDKGKAKRSTQTDFMYRTSKAVNIVGFIWRQSKDDPKLVMVGENETEVDCLMAYAHANKIEAKYDAWTEEFLNRLPARELDKEVLPAVLENFSRFSDRGVPALVLTGRMSTGKSPLLEALALFGNRKTIGNLGRSNFMSPLSKGLILTCDDKEAISTRSKADARESGGIFRNALSGQPLELEPKFGESQDAYIPWRMVIAQNNHDLQSSLSFGYSRAGDKRHLEAIYKRLCCIDVDDDCAKWMRETIPTLGIPEGRKNKHILHERIAQHTQWMVENPDLDRQERLMESGALEMGDNGQIVVRNQTTEDEVYSELRFLDEEAMRPVYQEIAKLDSEATEQSSLFLVRDRRLWITSDRIRALLVPNGLSVVEMDQRRALAKYVWGLCFRQPTVKKRTIAKSISVARGKVGDAWETGDTNSRAYRYFEAGANQEELELRLSCVPLEIRQKVRRVWTTVAEM